MRNFIRLVVRFRVAPGGLLSLVGLIVHCGELVSRLDFAFKVLVLGCNVLGQHLGPAKLAVAFDAEHSLLVSASQNDGRKGIDFVHGNIVGVRATYGVYRQYSRCLI